MIQLRSWGSRKEIAFKFQQLETVFWYNQWNKKFNWHSEHIAKYLGKHHIGDDYDYYIYEGILGHHQLV